MPRPAPSRIGTDNQFKLFSPALLAIPQVACASRQAATPRGAVAPPAGRQTEPLPNGFNFRTPHGHVFENRRPLEASKLFIGRSLWSEPAPAGSSQAGAHPSR